MTCWLYQLSLFNIKRYFTFNTICVYIILSANLYAVSLLDLVLFAPQKTYMNEFIF